MVFRNIFSAAILFFSAGIAFAAAEEPADEETRRETTYNVFNPATADSKTLYTRYFYDPAGSNRLTIQLPQYKGIAETESVWSHFSTGSNPGDAQGASRENPPRSNANDDGVDNDPAARSAAETGHAEPESSNSAENRVVGDMRGAYDFSIPFEDSITEAIGYTGSGDTETGFGVSEIETVRTVNGQQSDEGVYSILVFEKKAASNNPNRAKILFEEANADMFNYDDGYNNSPLTIPIVLFFFVLGAGVFLVLFTTINQEVEK